MTKTKLAPQWEPTGDTFIEPCDDKDCRYEFHQYAIHSDLNSNRLLVTDMDGNEEYETDSYLECTTQPDVLRAYLQSVWKTGNDYLGVLAVPVASVQNWSVTLAMWLGARKYGMRVQSGRRKGHRSVAPDKFPLEVGQFLEMSKRNNFYVSSVRSVAELEALAARDGSFKLSSRSTGLKAIIKFQVSVQRTATQNKRAIIQAAKKQLRQSQPTTKEREG